MVDVAIIKPISFKAFFENTIFLSSVISLFSAQLLKGIVYVISRRKKKTRELAEIVFWRTGGMPSSHSALVCSLATSVAFVEGVGSTVFIISFWFALVVLRDAVGVRRLAGLLAKSLNELGKQTSEKFTIPFRSVKEIQGHTPLEVLVGGLLGIVIAIGLNLF